jgi:aspartate-semialdehyde dehydrogenase
VLRCHSEAVNVEFAEAVTLDQARRALAEAPGIALMDDPGGKVYPMPAMLEGTDDTYVGRLRVDATVPHGLTMWVVADQLRKGAALNAVQIAEALLQTEPARPGA